MEMHNIRTCYATLRCYGEVGRTANFNQGKKRRPIKAISRKFFSFDKPDQLGVVDWASLVLGINPSLAEHDTLSCRCANVNALNPVISGLLCLTLPDSLNNPAGKIFCRCTTGKNLNGNISSSGLY